MTTTPTLSTYLPQTTSGTTTTYLPLPTAWPTIPLCSTPYWIPSGDALAFDPSIGASNTLLQCLPPAATSWWNQATPTPLFTVTSLGPLVCPSGYYVANQSAVNALSTMTACCPSSYTYETLMPAGTYGECKSIFGTGHTFIYYTADATDGPWTLQTSIWTDAVSGVVTALALNGYNFAPSSIAIPLTSSTTQALSSASTPSSASPTNTNQQSSTGLSTGVKAGIGIGVALSVLGLFLALGALYFIRRHRQESSLQGRTEDRAVGGEYGLAPVTELEGKNYQELPISRPRFEMDAGG